jgi:hypothetical protein
MEKDKLTYQKLLDQIAELKRTEWNFRLQSSIQNEEGLDYDYMTILNNIGDPVFLKDKAKQATYCKWCFLQKWLVVQKLI